MCEPAQSAIDDLRHERQTLDRCGKPQGDIEGDESVEAVERPPNDERRRQLHGVAGAHWVSCQVPAAAHTSSYCNRSGSMNTRSSVACPNGGTPQM